MKLISGSIRRMLVSGFLAVAVVLCVVGVAGYTSTREAQGDIATLVEEDVVLDREAHRAAVLMLQHRRYEKDIFLNIGDREKQTKKYMPKLAAKTEEMRAVLKSIARRVGEDEHLSPEVKAKAVQIEALYEAYHAGRAQVLQKAIAGGDITPQAANKAMAPHKEAIHDLETCLDTIAASAATMVKDTGEEASGNADFWVSFILVLVPLGLGLAALFATIAIRGVTQPVAAGIESLTAVAVEGDLDVVVDAAYLERSDELGQLARAIQALVTTQTEVAALAEAMARGDWTQTVKPRSAKDRLSLSLGSMTGQVDQALQTVRSTTTQVGAGADQISAASQSLSQGATEAAASLEEIASSMTEIGNQTRQNAESAKEANQLATGVRDAAQNGASQMEAMTQSMESIQSSSVEITKIIKTIDDIAFQTNLLALNAAVEAARAGRHGKGFAVVAEEVRNLAARSAKAAQETAQLIESSNERVQGGAEIVGQASHAFGEIVAGLAKAVELVGEIAAASHEQAQGVSQVSQALDQIEKVTQQNTANAEETASAAEELRSQARELQKLLARFTLSLSAASDVSAPSSAQPLPCAGTSGPAAGGWGQQKPGDGPSPSEGVLTPEVDIRLDDDEFGRY